MREYLRCQYDKPHKFNRFQMQHVLFCVFSLDPILHFNFLHLHEIVEPENIYTQINEKVHEKQEAFRERRHLHVCDLWPFCQGHLRFYY